MRDDGVIGRIEQQEWLKPAEDGLQKAIHKVFQVKVVGKQRTFFTERGSDIRSM